MHEKDEDGGQTGDFHEESLDRLPSASRPEPGQPMPYLSPEGWEERARQLPPRDPDAPPPMTMEELLARAGVEEGPETMPPFHPQIGPDNPRGPICDGPSVPLTGRFDEDTFAPQLDATAWAKALLEMEKDPNDRPIRLLAAGRMRARRRREEGGI